MGTSIGERFGIYFLLITATQPEILKKEDVICLTDTEKFMIADDFNRVKLFIEKKKKTIEEFAENFCNSFNDENCLIIINTKRKVNNFFIKFKLSIVGDLVSFNKSPF